MDKITAIITTYNSESNIRRTLDSILSQDGLGELFELEVIVVDDCSEDDTERIVRENYDVIFHKSEQNSGGPNKGRNIGLSKASGDYICIADHDDIWQSNRIVAVLPYLNKTPIVSSGYSLLDLSENKKVDRVKSVEVPFIYYEKDVTFLKCLSKAREGQVAYLGSIIFANSLSHIHFEEQHGVVDYDWLVRLFEGQDSIEVCSSLYTRLVDGKNLSLNAVYRKQDYEYSISFLKKYKYHYPNEVKLALNRINGTYARYFYMVDEMEKARHYFKKSARTAKTFLYIISTYWGSNLVKKFFKVFG